VVGAAADGHQTVVWTKAGELFTFGKGHSGQLGHGGHQNEYVPRLVESLAGKKVIGVSAGYAHTAVWTDEGELFTFGSGRIVDVGHWATEDKRMSMCRGSSGRSGPWWVHGRSAPTVCGAGRAPRPALEVAAARGCAAGGAAASLGNLVLPWHPVIVSWVFVQMQAQKAHCGCLSQAY